MALTGKTLRSSYKDILVVDNDNNGMPTTPAVITDGNGGKSVMSIADDYISLQPVVHDHHSTFLIKDLSNNIIFRVGTGTQSVSAGLGLHEVNTQIKEFGFCSVDAFPSTADTWTALATTRGRAHELQMGTGSTPATSLTITTTAEALVTNVWYVPLNIAIDSCNVWFGADAASGDDVKFSVMSYTVDSTNGATGGDLSSGTELCVSPSTITGGGYEQAYFQQLTVSSANVDAGKMIMACVHQNGTNADLSVNMQLVYHLR